MKQIKDFPDYFVTEEGEIWSKRTKLKKLKCSSTSEGYHRVALFNDAGKFNKRVHRLVAEVYVEGDQTLTVNHKDGNKLNNHYSNLEWVSNEENLRHSFENKLTPRGEKISTSKFTSQKVLEIRKRLEDGEKVKDLAIEFKVSKQSIYDIRDRKFWNHI